MKRHFLRFGFGVSSVIVLVVAMTSAFGQGRQPGGTRLEGSWNVRVTTRNCQNGDPIRSFDSVTQFMQGGTLIDSTSGVPQALKTPGEGIWEHTTGMGYRFKIKSFGFDANNNYTGYTIIQHTAELNTAADAYESAGTASIYSPDGTLLVTLCSTTVATRMTF
jgi:hypothetical protein